MQLSDNNPVDWNVEHRRQLLGQGASRLPHAMLLIGPSGVGKTAFAEQIAALLLCESPSSTMTACGECDSCRWLAAGNHPDFRRVAPDDEGDSETGQAEKSAEKGKKRSPGIIRIDQIRDLEGFVFVGSHRNGNRVVLVTEAEAMNPAAANSLLKILEEPPSSVYFILISNNQKNCCPPCAVGLALCHFLGRMIKPQHGGWSRRGWMLKRRAILISPVAPLCA